MRTLRFWLDVSERAVKTAAQTAAGLLVAGPVGVLDVDWQQIASVAGLAMVVSVLTSIASSRVATRETASLVD